MLTGPVDVTKKVLARSGMNMSEIRNPHRIYPGQQLVLERLNGRARLRMAGAGEGPPTETIRVSPRVRYENLGDAALPTLKASLIDPFLSEPLIVDENGHLIDGDQLLAVIAESWSEDGRLAGGGVVATVMSNLGLERYLAEIGIKLVRASVGDRYVLDQMRTNGFNVGGEPSGHIILSDYTTTGDGLVTALQLLAVVKKLGQPVSKVCHRFDPLPQIMKNVRYSTGKPLENAKVRSAIKSGEKRLNGHGRLVIRPSGTEPVIRVMGEGDDKTLVEAVVDDIVGALTDVAA